MPRRSLTRSPSVQAQSLQNLAPHHRAMARLAAQGARPGDLALRFGLSSPQISKIMASPLFQSEVNRLSEGFEAAAGEAELELVGLVPKALEVIAEGLHGSTEGPEATITKKEKRHLAFEVLDRTGYGKKGELHIGDKVVNITYATPEPGTPIDVALEQVEGIRAKIESGRGPEEEEADWVQ